jgi:hypothetical protein
MKLFKLIQHLQALLPVRSATEIRRPSDGCASRSVERSYPALITVHAQLLLTVPGEFY